MIKAPRVRTQGDLCDILKTFNSGDVLSVLFSKPVALSIGPQACGSDILHTYFSKRPDVATPDVREIFYFDRHVQRGAEFYAGHFTDSKDVKMFMELTTTAFDHAQAPDRVLELLGPDVKLFCPLRDPVDRAMAVYEEYLGYGIVKGSIEKACEEAPQILYASRYADHLEEWLKLFPDIYFISYADIERDAPQVIFDLCAHLGLKYIDIDKGFALPRIFMPLKTKKRQKTSKNNEVRLWLERELGAETQRMRDLTGKTPF